MQEKNPQEERMSGSQTKITQPFQQIETFQGDNIALKGRVFAIGPDQASRYDATYKDVLEYISENFDHRVHTAIKQKDRDVGMNLLT